jgi:hypothetical protein
MYHSKLCDCYGYEIEFIGNSYSWRSHLGMDTQVKKIFLFNTSRNDIETIEHLLKGADMTYAHDEQPNYFY